MFPNNKTLSYPLIIIGIVMIVCGFRWLIHPNPWMLDEVANVERLGITFDELFAPEINTTLPDYLRQIYSCTITFLCTLKNPIYAPLQQKHVHVSSLPNYPSRT